MTSIAQLLTPEAREALASAAAIKKAQVPVCTCKPDHAGFNTLPGTTLAVHAICGYPKARALDMFPDAYAEALGVALDLTAEPEVEVEVAEAAPVPELHVPDLPPVTTINGVEVDLRSDGTHETECADCKTPLEVDIKPEGVDLEMLVSKPRVAVCTDCGKARIQGKRGTVVHRKPAVKRHQPRVTDGIDHPVEVKTTQKEATVDVDLTKYSAAEFAAMAVAARERMEAQEAERIKAESRKAAKAERKTEKKRKREVAQAQDERKGRVLAGFTAKGVEVPTLDLSDVADLNETVSSKMRSPYNKARYRLSLPVLDKDATTYAVLAEVHEEMLAEASEAPEPKAKKRKVAKVSAQAEDMGAKVPKTGRLLADLDPAAKAKVNALAKVKGVSKSDALTQLVGKGII